MTSPDSTISGSQKDPAIADPSQQWAQATPFKTKEWADLKTRLSPL